MYRYDFIQADSLQCAYDVLKKYGADAGIVAGGTDIMVQIREKAPRWKNMKCLLDISRLSELKGIEDRGDALFIGALCTHTEIENDPLVKKYMNFLSVACSTVGSPQIRNLGTIGGSICNASPAADPLTPLVALGAQVIVIGENGERSVELCEFYKGKGQVDLNREEGELVKGFLVPKMPEGGICVFKKLGRRKALAISRLNVSLALTMDADGTISWVRLSPGCIFRTPMRVEKAEQLLLGQKPSAELFKAAGEAVSEVMIELTGWRWSTEYKKPAIEGVVQEALELAMEVK